MTSHLDTLLIVLRTTTVAGVSLSTLLQGAAIATLGSFAFSKLSRKKRTVDGAKKPRNTVLLYQFYTSDKAKIQLSSPCLKLEAYLRVNKVPYKDCRMHSPAGSPKKTAPYVEYNDMGMADSTLIIDWLEQNGVVSPMDAHLTPVEKAQVEAFRYLFEEGLYWQMLHSRWQHEPNWPFVRDVFFFKLPGILKYLVAFLVRRGQIKALRIQKTGRHTFEETLIFSDKIIQAASDLLGDKKYMLSNTRMCSLDMIAFANLSNVLYLDLPDTRMQQQVAAKKNLVEYCDRMMAEIFPNGYGR
ncbi:hypothetical protein SpCBS45565_g04335 [Spizellomyces sp. 'palustris']|nr:hypothetical protein SpCBS45565_g04335 [Spizellomyces sp. 'palustris']